jgi:hypothetical protein
MLIDNFGIIVQVELHVKTRQNQDIFEAKMWKWQRITRPNAARSQVRCGHDVNNWCKLIADWLIKLKLYKLVGEWLCANTRYGTFAIAYILKSKKKISCKNIRSVYLVNCHLWIHTHFQNFIVIIWSKNSVTCCLHLP